MSARGRGEGRRDCGTMSYSVFVARYRMHLIINGLCFQILVGSYPSLYKDKSKTRGFGTGRLFE